MPSRDRRANIHSRAGINPAPTGDAGINIHSRAGTNPAPTGDAGINVHSRAGINRRPYEPSLGCVSRWSAGVELRGGLEHARDAEHRLFREGGALDLQADGELRGLG